MEERECVGEREREREGEEGREKTPGDVEGFFHQSLCFMIYVSFGAEGSKYEPKKKKQ